MKSSSQDTFKQATASAFADPSIKLNKVTQQDALNLMSSFNEQEKLKGGKADKKTLRDVAKKHTWPKGDPITRIHYINQKEEELKSELKKGIKVEMEHTKDEDKAKQIAIDHLWKDPKYYRKLKKIEGKEQDEKITAKKQFSQDLQSDKDFLEFKKNAKYKKGGAEFTFGVPNVSHEDPYIKKQTKYGRPGRGKEETIEATGSGSSGSFVGPIAFSKEFMKRSNAENPKPIKEDIGEGETTEATTTGSSGAYETPSAWAKSTKAKDWGGKRKTQYPGGSFVSVKKKCTKFPYCNQGDINALKLTKNESVSEAIKNVANKLGLKESYIRAILEYEYEKLNKRTK